MMTQKLTKNIELDKFFDLDNENFREALVTANQELMALSEDEYCQKVYGMEFEDLRKSIFPHSALVPEMMKRSQKVEGFTGRVTPVNKTDSISTPKQLKSRYSGALHIQEGASEVRGGMYMKGCDFLRVYHEQGMDLKDFRNLLKDCGDSALMRIESLKKKYSIARIGGIAEYDQKIVGLSGLYIYFSWGKDSEGNIDLNRIDKIALELSGQYFNGTDLVEDIIFFKALYNYGFTKCTRIDLAMDDFAKQLKYDEIVKACESGGATNLKVRGGKVNGWHLDHDPTGKTMYVGSANSANRLVVYDTFKKHGYDAQRLEGRLTREKSQYLWDLIGGGLVVAEAKKLGETQYQSEKQAIAFGNLCEMFGDKFNPFSRFQNREDRELFKGYLKIFGSDFSGFDLDGEGLEDREKYHERIAKMFSGYILGITDFVDKQGKYKGKMKGQRLNWWSKFINRINKGFTIRNGGKVKRDKSIIKSFKWLTFTGNKDKQAGQCAKSIYKMFIAIKETYGNLDYWFRELRENIRLSDKDIVDCNAMITYFESHALGELLV